MMKETGWKVIKKDGVAKMFDGSLSIEDLQENGYEIVKTDVDRTIAQNVVNELNSSFHSRGASEPDAAELELPVPEEEDETEEEEDDETDEICEECGEYSVECICEDDEDY